MNNNLISLEERKTIQFEMLKEIDAFCRSNDIRYSLAFGTLLGAIRHKGFIPWDDDVDIMMPLPDMLRFKKLFHSESMKYCDVDTEKYYGGGFSRIANMKTYRKSGMLSKEYGVSIDLYPFVSIPDDDDNKSVFFSGAEKLQKRRLAYLRWRGRLIRFLPLKTIPGFTNAIRNYRDFMFNQCPYGSTHTFYVIAGPLSLWRKMSYNGDMFDKLIEVEFENYKFLSISQYDKYLTLRYGDYMKLPPEDQRHPYHNAQYYWK